jgi:hypothetical protein
MIYVYGFEMVTTMVNGIEFSYLYKSIHKNDSMSIQSYKDSGFYISSEFGEFVRMVAILNN